ncbi:thioesterase family protein [Nocardia sp. CNY236]|uniref:thioesterase family protein n=1 Tax=Nocardia sp. CNY236 TaxID=1169152 RepID=UPI0003F93C03|nr:thioesterase family protein [Nocardia sp. CNY236]
MTTELTADIGTVAANDAPFSRVCALTPLPASAPDSGRYLGTIDGIWTIGTKLHGGTMVAASAAAATNWLRSSEAAPTGMAPIAASSDFLGAPDPGEVEYEVRVRKRGRQICLADVDLVQGGRVMVRTALTFGRLDDADPIHISHDVDMPVQPSEDAFSYEPGTPMGEVVHVGQGAEAYLDSEWARFARGETGEPRLRMWIRPRAADAQDPDVAMFFAMMSADMSPPVPMNLGRVGWAPTVQLTTYLRRRPAPGWLRIIASAHEVGERIFDEDQTVIDSTGAVVAQSRQLAFVPQRWE